MTDSRTDEQLRTIDVPAELAVALLAERAPAGEVTVAATLAAERRNVRPRSLTFLAEVVRRGGIGYAVTLPEPLPEPEQTALASSWLIAAASVEDPGPTHDETVARWLENVALVLAVRTQAGAGRSG